MKRIVVIVAAGLMLAACADSGSSETTSADPTPAPDTTTAATAAPDTAAPDTTAAADGPAATINISGSTFGSSPTVSVGDEVEVINNDAIPHTWTSTDDVFDSGSLGQGDSFSFTFDEAGEYDFICSIHPTMTGTVTVEG